MLEKLWNLQLQSRVLLRGVWRCSQLNVCIFVVVSFVFENFRNHFHGFFLKGIPECSSTSTVCYASTVKDDWCLSFSQIKGIWQGMPLWTKKGLDLRFCFLKEVDHLDLLTVRQAKWLRPLSLFTRLLWPVTWLRLHECMSWLTHGENNAMWTYTQWIWHSFFTLISELSS